MITLQDNNINGYNLNDIDQNVELIMLKEYIKNKKNKYGTYMNDIKSI